VDCLATSAATRGLLVSGFEDAGGTDADSDGEEWTEGNVVEMFVPAVFVVLAASEALVVFVVLAASEALVVFVALAGAGKRAHDQGPAQSAINVVIAALDPIMVDPFYHSRSILENGCFGARDR